jgi:deoxyadenosine/deoxycytidine kinase
VIVIINGPCGIGKTSVAWELNARFDRALRTRYKHDRPRIARARVFLSRRCWRGDGREG